MCKNAAIYKENKNLDQEINPENKKIKLNHQKINR